MTVLATATLTRAVTRRGYWTEIWKAHPFGWLADWTDYGDGDIIGVGPIMGPTWRPTRSWALRVVRRRVERMKRADARHAAREIA